MPVNIDEVRRAFSANANAGTTNGNAPSSDATGSGDASSGNGASVASVTRTDVDAIDSDRTVSPAAAVSRIDTGKRARAGSGTSSTADNSRRTRAGNAVVARPETANNLERLLFTIHTMLASKTDLKSLKIPPAEAKELATAVNELNALYGGKGGVLGPKTYAWITFLIALGGTYAPMYTNVKKEMRDKVAANGTDLPTGP